MELYHFLIHFIFFSELHLDILLFLLHTMRHSYLPGIPLSSTISFLYSLPFGTSILCDFDDMIGIVADDCREVIDSAACLSVKA